jgi:hypothetical protein
MRFRLPSRLPASSIGMRDFGVWLDDTSLLSRFAGVAEVTPL